MNEFEFTPKPVVLDMSDERLRRFYGFVLDMSIDYLEGKREGREITDYLGYLQKIYGSEVGGHIVGVALNDAQWLSRQPVIEIG